MANRKWKVCWNMGYAGTENEEEIDLVDDLGYTVEQADRMNDSDAEFSVADYVYEKAKDIIMIAVRPMEK